jgi:uncharacterized membrane protein
MSYSFNKDYNTLSGIYIPLNIYDNRFQKILGESQNTSQAVVYTGNFGGVYAIPNFQTADASISDTDFFIDFGDGTIVENNLSAFHTYKTSGNFPITLVVTNSAGNFFRGKESYIVNINDPVPDKIFLTQSANTQDACESTIKFYISRYNNIVTSRNLSANDYRIKLSVQGNLNKLQQGVDYLENKNLQYENKSFFFTSPDENFEIIDSIKTNSEFIYGKMEYSEEAGSYLNLSTLSSANSQLVGTSGSASFMYYEPGPLSDQLGQLLVITSPEAGQNIESNSFTCLYKYYPQFLDPSAGYTVDHVHLILDGGSDVRDLDFDGSYTFTGVSYGDHTLEAFLATSDHVEIPASRTSVTFSTTETISYTLSSNKTSVNEGDTFSILLSATGINDGTSIPFTISGIQNEDISESTTGSFTINNDISVKTFNVESDLTTEGSETFTIALNNGQASKAVTINDTSLTQAFELSSNKASVNEGSTVKIALSTQNVSSGTTLPYTISGPGISINDFVGLSTLTGNFITDTTDSITLTLSSDTITEGSETFTVALNNGKASKEITINDTSVSTFSLGASTTSVNEGDSFTITLTTAGVADGTSVPYTITGIESGDISESLTGNFSVTSNTATATFNVNNDVTTEGSQTFTITLDNGEASKSVTINDTSVETYSLSSPLYINEGSSFNVILNTVGVSDSTTLNYTVTGISSTDMQQLSTGTFTVASSAATTLFTLSADLLTDGNKGFVLSLDNGKASVSACIIDTSTNPETESLKMLEIRGQSIYSSSSTSYFGAGTNAFRSQDDIDMFTISQYTSSSNDLDTLLDSDTYDVVWITDVNSLNYTDIQFTATTIEKLSGFVTRGGTVIKLSEHWNYNSYTSADDGAEGCSGQITELIYNMGGVTGSNSGWKDRSNSGTVYLNPTTQALSADIVNSGQITVAYSETIQNSRSNGIPIYNEVFYGTENNESPIHLWDGSSGHLNAGIQGKIVYIGDQNFYGYSGGGIGDATQFSRFLEPFYDYIARTK